MAGLIGILTAIAMCFALAAGATTQNVKAGRGAPRYVVVENEPAPLLHLVPTRSDQRLRGIVLIQYQVANVRAEPVSRDGALSVTPQVGHRHVTIDDLPWHWAADTSDNNTIDAVGMPPGPHKALIEMVNPVHHVFTGPAVTFTVSDPAN